MSGFPATATLASLTDEVIHNLSGFTQRSDVVASLGAALDASALTVTVDDASGFARGIAEIDDELVFIKSVDLATNTLTLAPGFGRGARGSLATTHALNAMVSMGPVWPRATVSREINNCIRALYPNLFAVRNTSLTYDTNQYAYELPADAEIVLDVRWREQGSTRDWVRARYWDTDFMADVTDFPSGKAVQIFQGIPAGVQVQVVYGAMPTPLAAPGDGFATVTGLEESAKDLVVLGACSRLAPYMDISRLGTKTVESSELDQPRPVGAAIQIGRDFRRQYLERLADEVAALGRRFPARYRRVR